MNQIKLIIMLLISIDLLFSQGLFESSSTNVQQDKNTFELNGFIRSTAYSSEDELHSLYSEAGLFLKSNPSDFGSAFSELRFTSGYLYGSKFTEIVLREAYVDASLWHLDLRLGKQIVMWGRADGFNPTNNITPLNTTIRSPNSDDMYIGNFLARGYFNFNTEIRLEGIWVPQYSPTTLAFEIADLPENITIGSGNYPNSKIKNGAIALRLNLEYPALDGSISYFNGYNPTPGIIFNSVDLTTYEMEIIPIAYRQQVYGIDFSTTIGSWGLRGEGAYRIPEEEHNGLTNYYIPYSDLYFVAGLDHAWGDFNLLIQYIGRYIPDFEKLIIPSDPTLQLYPQLENYNRLFSNQTDKYRQAISIRPSLSLMYDALSLELYSMYDITTGEMMTIPQIVYKPSDGLVFTIGINYYQGDSGTLYDLIEDSYNSIFCELKLSF